MKRVLFILFFIAIVFRVHAATGYDMLLEQLNHTLDEKPHYDKLKARQIAKLEEALTHIGSNDLNGRYRLCLSLYNEYKSYNYSKAFRYTQQIQQTGRLLNDPQKIAYGKIKLGFILLSSGLFKETFDSLKTVNVKILDTAARKEFYFLTARTYYDLADFVQDDYYTSIYNSRAGKYIDSATSLCAPNSFEYIYYNGLKLLKLGNTGRAIENLKSLLNTYRLTDHQYAIAASTLSDIYIRKSEPDSAITLLIKASMADVRSSTKEAAAMTNLAQLLYKNGDVKDAYVYIKQSMADAIFYGARQRKLQVGAILPIIAGDRITTEEDQKRRLLLFASVLFVLICMVIVFAIIIYKQLQRLRAADKLILEANHNLQQNIIELNEANKIKEEYIGYYFNLISEYINKLDKFKRSVDTKLITKRYDDIGVLVNNINLTKEREELFINFDKAFLKIFPHFVERYNELFAEENRVKLLPNQLLNTDLRIFALIRLGIHDTEQIAQILEYSVNTIYNYKARIKSKSLVHNDEFENAILAIKAL